ncbi:hypothetical protein GIB67_003184, partial [Kingdonia uniflora]
MEMSEGDPHPSTLPGFRVTRDPERAVTRLRSRTKKKRVKFEDVQQTQTIPHPPEENYPTRFITILPDGISHIYYTGKELTGSAILVLLYHGLDTAVTTGGAITGFSQLLEYWFYEYYGVGHPNVKEEVMRHANFVDCDQFLIGDERETYASYYANKTYEVCHLLKDSQRMGNIDLFGPTALRAGIIPVVIRSTAVHSLSQDFSLPCEEEGPDPRWHMEWIGRREMLPIHHLRDPPPLSSFYSAEELWHLTH